jgi:hypothetical protein
MLWPKSAHRPLDIASASVARLTLLYIWRPRSTVPQRSSALGGFLMPGDVTFEAPVAPLVLAHSLAPFDLRIPVRFRTKGGFLAAFSSSFWRFCTQKPVRF